MDKFKDLVEGFTGKISDIKVEDIYPDKKDNDRVANLKPAQEDKMANAIKDPVKLVRRTKAYILKNGDIPNPFLTKMEEMGFTKSQMAKMSSVEQKPELPEPVKRNGKDYKSSRSYDRDYVIMNASIIYKGKVSKVIEEVYGDTVILLGLANNKRKVAIVGSASGMKIDEHGLDFYQVPKGGWLDYKIDTGNGYREPQSEIVLTDYILVKDGKAVTKFKDQSYSYYVFK